MDIIKQANQQLSNIEIGDGTTVRIPKNDKGFFAGREVIVVRPPIKGQTKNMQGDLEVTYNKIFDEAQKIKSRLVNVPCFSTGKGGVTPQESAEVAIRVAASKLSSGTQLNVNFVCFNDTEGNANKLAYEKVLNKTNLSDEVKNKIHIVTGNITHQTHGALVMPVRENYNLQQSGPTAQAIDRVAQIELKQTKIDPTKIREKNLFDDKDYIRNEDL